MPKISWATVIVTLLIAMFGIPLVMKWMGKGQ